MYRMPDNFVDCVITSPPYWNLRDYKIEPVIWDGDENCNHKWKTEKRKDDAGQEHYTGPVRWQHIAKEAQEKNISVREVKKDVWEKGVFDSAFCIKCNAWRGQLGLEPTFELFITHLCDIFDEVKRVLNPTGSCWINLGDSYGGSWGKSSKKEGSKRGGSHGIDTRAVGIGTEGNFNSTKGYEKSLLMIPQRFAIEMCSRGWILRNVIIWHKKNCMPHSAKDRFTVDFEYLYFFVKSKKYYFKQQFEKYITPLDRWGEQIVRKDYKTKTKQFAIQERSGRNMRPNEQGRNKRCVWNIATQPFSEAHFAVFPEKLIETPILAGCPENGICYDPFMGAGTVAKVALRANRNFIGSEISPEYCRIAEKRIAQHKSQLKLQL